MQDKILYYLVFCLGQFTTEFPSCYSLFRALWPKEKQGKAAWLVLQWSLQSFDAIMF